MTARARFAAAVRLAPLALALLGFALRAYSVGAQALRGDEAFSVSFSAQPPRAILAAMASTEPNPPLYWFTLHAWQRLAGRSEAAVRWPSVLAGAVTVALAYRLGRALFGWRAGCLGALLAALNPLLVWYGQDARTYSLLAALVLGAAWQAWEAAQRGGWLRWLAAGLLWWLALWAHYFAALPFAAVGLAVLLTASGRRRWEGAAAWLLVALAYGPWALYVGPLLAGHAKDWVGTLAPWDVAWRLAAAAGAGTAASGATPMLRALGGIAAAGLLLLGLRRDWRGRRAAAIWLAALGIGPALVLWLVSLVRPAFTEQYVLASLPALLVLAGAAVAAPPRAVPPYARWLPAGLLFGALAVMAAGLANYYYDPAFAKSPNWRGVVQYLEATARPNEVVVLNLPDPAFYYYYTGDASVEASPPLPFAQAGAEATDAQLAGLRDRFDHVRFFFQPSPAYDPEGYVGQWLEACCERLSDEFVFGFRVQTYATPRGSLAARTAYPVAFERGLQLTGYRLAPQAAGPGESAHLTLYWQAARPVAESYTVFVHLLAYDGFVVLGADGLPRGGQRPTFTWQPNEDIIDPHPFTLPADLPPGEYHIEVGLYQLDTGDRLPTLEGGSAVRLPVTIQVEVIP